MDTVDSMQNEIVELFETFGVAALEAKVYLSLLSNSGVSGYQLSKNAGISTSKVYTVVSRLIEKGFVVAAESRPVKYYPRPPKELLADIKKDVTKNLDHLEDHLDRLVQTTPFNHDLAWNIIGRRNVISRAKDLIRSAQKSIFIAIWPKELRLLRKDLESAGQRTEKIRLLSYGPVKMSCGEIFIHRPSDYPFRERGERRFILTVDNKIAVIATLLDDEDDAGLWTENPGLVHLFRDFVIHEIYIAQVEKAYPKEIEKLAGRDWENLRIR